MKNSLISWGLFALFRQTRRSGFSSRYGYERTWSIQRLLFWLSVIVTAFELLGKPDVARRVLTAGGLLWVVGMLLCLFLV